MTRSAAGRDRIGSPPKGGGTGNRSTRTPGHWFPGTDRNRWEPMRERRPNEGEDAPKHDEKRPQDVRVRARDLLDTVAARRIAVMADTDPRTVDRVITGQPTRPGVRLRVVAALLDCGLDTLAECGLETPAPSPNEPLQASPEKP